jgi:hypothetical protein
MIALKPTPLYGGSERDTFRNGSSITMKQRKVNGLSIPANSTPPETFQ